jgi:hypothetical protein
MVGSAVPSAPGAGPGSGTGPAGGAAGVQLATATATPAATDVTKAAQRARRYRGEPASAAVVAKPELDAEILALETGDDRLQLVP